MQASSILKCVTQRITEAQVHKSAQLHRQVELHMSYTRLSQDERHQVQFLHGGDFFAREVGVALQRAAVTISRELLRNWGAKKYQAQIAQRQSVKRWHAASMQARILPAERAAAKASLTAE